MSPSWCILTLVFTQAPEPRPIVMLPTSQPATSRPVDPPRPAEEVIDGFLRHVESHPQASAESRKFIQESRAKLATDSSNQFVVFSLAVLYPDFKKAVDLLEADRPGDAAAALERLAGEADPFLAVNSAILASTPLMELEELDRCLKLLTRIRKDHAPIDRYTLAPEQFEFALGYCQVHALDYVAAQETLEAFLRRYPNAPDRLRVIATQIVTELSRRVPRQLGDVRDLLVFARRHIRQGDTGEPVRQRQQEAVAMLDDLIKEAEEQEKSQSSASSGSKSRGGKSGQQPGQGGGAKQSQLYRGSAPDANLRRTQARPGEAWGRMPPREREAILQSMQQQFPGRYRELLEQYYKQLAKDSAAP